MKIYSVQYLRGLAAVLVLLAHSILHPLAYPVFEVVRIGAFGVAMFFVISGFIMVTISGDGAFNRLDFYSRRIARVVPLYWTATFAVAIAAYVAPALFRNTEVTLRQLILSLLFIPHYRPNHEIVPLLKLGWTLNLEMFFYACFGLLAPLRARSRVALLSIFFVGLAIIGLTVPLTNAILRAYTMFDLVSFSIGMGVGFANLKGWTPAGSRRGQAVALALAVALLALGFGVAFNLRPTPLVTALLAGGSAALLMFGLGVERHLRHWRFATLLGDASYSLYLIHMYFVGTAVAVVHRLAPTLPLPAIVVIGVVSGLAGGIATHLLVEKPLMVLFRRPKKPPAHADHAAVPVPPDGMSPAVMEETTR